MSGERCSSGSGFGSSKTGSYKHQPRIVRPEVVAEKSFVENVAGFINEVAPQTSGNPYHYEDKETIEWVKFEQCDLNDPSLAEDSYQVLPLLLILGYSKGVQGWLVPSTGEAVEVFSWRRTTVRAIKVLPSPILTSQSSQNSCGTLDRFSNKRPLLAVCDDASSVSPPLYNIITFESLKSGDVVKTYKFHHSIVGVEANRRVVVIVFPERLAVLCAASLEERFTVTSCYLAPHPNLNPVALGETWLAYAERRLHSHYNSGGGASLESTHTYKAAMMQYAKTFSKSVLELKDTMSSLLGSSTSRGASSTSMAAGSCGGATGVSVSGHAHSPSPPPLSGGSHTPGVITILDVENVPHGDVNLSHSEYKGVVAHFTAHHGYPVVAMQFDPSGCLFLTADQPGNFFHVFRIHPHPNTCSLSAVHHLYTLHRGDTTAKVIDVSFSFDSRWVAVSTLRGTTHVFPITPYGGDITVRTHTSPSVVNRQSRYERSARLDDNPSPSGRNSPTVGSGGSSSSSHHPHHHPHHHAHHHEGCPSPALAYPNPRLPPYPYPCILSPYVQLRQPLLSNLLGTIGASPTAPRSNTSTRGSSPYTESPDIVKVVSCFGSPRGWVSGSPSLHSPQLGSGYSCNETCAATAQDSLFVMAYHGNLIQYSLQPRPSSVRPSEKPSSSAHIQLEAHAVAQWSLLRETDSSEVRPPLPDNNPLLYVPSKLQQQYVPTSSGDSSGGLHHTAFSPNTSPEEVEHSWPGELDITTHSGPDRRNSLGPQFVLCPQAPPPSDEHSRYPRSSPVDIQGSTTPIVLDASSYGSGSYSASPGLVERMSDLHMGSCGDISSQIQQGISDALEDDPSLASGQPNDSVNDDDDDWEAGVGGHIMDDYEGSYGTVVGKRTPSIISQPWSGSSRSLEAMDPEQHPSYHQQQAARVRQLSATQHYPITHDYGGTSPSLFTSTGMMPSVALATTGVAHTKSPVVVTTTSATQSGLEESKGMTSSAEELSTTLIASYHGKNKALPASGSKKKNIVSSGATEAWVPIAVASCEGELVPLERPEPTKRGGNKSSGWCPNKTALSLQLKEDFDSNNKALREAQTGTSDDETCFLTSAPDNKKEKKKKKKRAGKNTDSDACLKNEDSEGPKQDSELTSNAALTLSTDHFNITPPETEESPPATLDVSLCIDENLDDNIVDTHGNIATCSSAVTSTSALDNLDDFELQADEEYEENGNSTRLNRGPRLISEHSEEELARALEEARSDDDCQFHYTKTPPTVRRAAPRVSENFPYRLSSSEDEDKSATARNVEVDEAAGAPDSQNVKADEWPALGPATLPSRSSGSMLSGEDLSTDDRGETSGEDRRYATDSNVSQVKSKKKKKKRR